MSEHRSPNCTCAGRGEPPPCTAGCDIDRRRVRDHLEDCAFNVWVYTDNHRHDCAIRIAARGELNAPDSFARKLLAAITADPDLAAINVGAVMEPVNIVTSELTIAWTATAEASMRDSLEGGMRKFGLAIADMIDAHAGSVLTEHGTSGVAGVCSAATLVRDQVGRLEGV